VNSSPQPESVPRWTDPERARDETDSAESTLRPQRLQDFIGQERVKGQLGLFLEAARQRGEVLDHVLFYGPPGLGKTTLAGIIAHEMQTELRVTSGPAFQNTAELVSILSSDERSRCLFIDEIHRLSRIVEEHLYPAMEDLTVELTVDKGPAARHYQLGLEPFTLIGATTRAGMITPAMRSRFGIVLHLDFYPPSELEVIVKRTARILEVDLEAEGAREIALRSRGTPRVANRLLRRVRDVAQVEGSARIDRGVVDRALTLLGVDSLGLESLDRQYLEALVKTFDGGPVGISTLAVGLGEESDTLEDVVEPFLIQRGLVQRTPRGRQASRRAFEHLGLRARVGEDPHGGAEEVVPPEGKLF
jgi:holliday junction DNA helicase RuvB